MSDNANFEIYLEQYDGPLDLLLHLVKKRELPIERLSLVEVASQYLNCLSKLVSVDFDLASEYLVIAATLVSLKSSTLLGLPGETNEILDENIEINPHEELLMRLRKADIYRETAVLLADYQALGFDVFASQPNKTPAISIPVLKNHDPLLLGKVLRRLMLKAKDQGSEIVITLDSISITDQMIRIVDRLRETSGRLKFDALFAGNFSMSAVISSFLALLELCKRSVVNIHQEEWCDSISLSLADNAAQSRSFNENVLDRVDYG